MEPFANRVKISTLVNPTPVVAAIVPALNEEQTIGSVVETLVASPRVDEVIVVSDGSTDGTAEVARSAGARVVELPKRGGKGAAMLHGVAQTDAPILLFADADLKGFTTDHVERLLAPVISGGRIMNVGLRDRGPFIGRFARFLPLIGGERAMKRSIIEQIPPEYLSGFMVESALNYYCRSRGLSYGSVPLAGLSIRRKYEKVGWAEGLRQYWKMSKQVATAMIRVRVAKLRGKF